jgi:signal transduction histidine kinase
MVEEVLDFAKGTSSDLNLVATELDIYLLTLCQPIKQKLATMGIELVLKQEVEGNLFIQIDNDRLIRVFENLIRNAQEAIWSDEQHPRGKHIWITIGGDQESVTVRIADDGPGIPEGMEKNLFEAYITGKKKTGSGLGLATARNLVKAHGGEISVEPRGPEGGAVFLLSFPRTTNG